MDNATYDELSVMPVSSDETYSRLRVINNKVKPNDEIQRRGDTDHSSTKGVKPIDIKKASNSTKFNIVLITTMAILLLLTLISIVMTATTFSRLTSEQSKLVRQQDKNEGTDSDNNFTQLILTQNNMSQTLSQLHDQLSHFISAQINDTRGHLQYECGPGLWWRVAYLDMTDPSQQCPSAWREYNTSGVKACGRPANSNGSCAAEVYCINRQYSRVCGRIIGYQFGSPDAFNKNNLDGVIISHGAQQEYIWSYIAGLTENSSQHSADNCPCTTEAGIDPPTHIGDNYYCESGNPDSVYKTGRLYPNDKLWDGKQCDREGTCCTDTKSPPWFSVQLPAPTTGIIEVSICCDQETVDEDTPVELIEIYVQ